MIRLLKYHKTLGIILIVTFLSLINTSDIEPANIHLIPHIDKIVHFLMYYSMAFFLMFEYYVHHKHKITKYIQVLIIPIFWGAAMEITQMVLTDYRGAEWLDMLANTFGVMCAYISFYILKENKLLNQFILFPFFNSKITT